MSNFNVDSVDSWSKGVKHKEDLRGLVGQEVEVLAIYGRKRRFTVGVDFEGNLTEIIPGKEWTWCESEYATIKVLSRPERRSEMTIQKAIQILVNIARDSFTSTTR